VGSRRRRTPPHRRRIAAARRIAPLRGSEPPCLNKRWWSVPPQGTRFVDILPGNRPARREGHQPVESTRSSAATRPARTPGRYPASATHPGRFRRSVDGRFGTEADARDGVPDAVTPDPAHEGPRADGVMGAVAARPALTGETAPGPPREANENSLLQWAASRV
jgi:hypothetical protein